MKREPMTWYAPAAMARRAYQARAQKLSDIEVNEYMRREEEERWPAIHEAGAVENAERVQ